MDHTGNRRKLSPRMIVILALALIVLAEGAFLLLHRKSGGTDAGADTAAAAESTEPAQENGSAQAEASAAPEAGKTETTPAPSETADEKAGSKQAESKDGGAQAPAQTPAVTIPPENRGKAYAGAIAGLENYVKSPSAGTIAYLLGGELLGEQMQRFLPALLTLSGQGTDLMQAELDAAFGLPAGTTALTITGEQALGADDLNTAREQLRKLEQSFAAIAESFSEYSAFTDEEWKSIGSQLSLSGADAKRLIREIADSAGAMAQQLSGTDVTDGYAVALKTNTGATTATNVYCIAGKWVTSAFFNMEFD